MFVNTGKRSTETELMDDLLMEGSQLRQTLDQIAMINKRLGGNNATIGGLQTLLNYSDRNSPVRILDLGCGNGDMLRLVADLGRKHNRDLSLIGIDANAYTITYAKELSLDYPEIRFLKMDALSDSINELEFDIVLATLFLHHFTNAEIEDLLNKLINKARTGIIVNDLHRSRSAYYLFKFISLFIRNPMVKNDGAVSVLRGFKKQELIHISNKLKNSRSSISWKWAFRYQWIIKRTWV